MSNKLYYADDVQIIIDGKKPEVIRIAGMGYNPNIVKSTAIERAKKLFGGERFTAVIASHNDLTLEEYKAIVGKNPEWLINSNDEKK